MAHKILFAGVCFVAAVYAMLAEQRTAVAAENGAESLASKAAPAWVSGEAIPVGTADRLGPMSAGLASEAIGAAFVYGGAEKDLFVVANTHSSPPGLFLYRYMGRHDGLPVFGHRVAVTGFPGKEKTPPNGAIFQTPDKKIYGWWLAGAKVLRTQYNAEQRRFEPCGEPLKFKGLPESPNHVRDLGVSVSASGEVTLLVGMGDGVRQKPPEDLPWQSAEFRPYDAADVYRGGWPMVYLYGGTVASVEAAGPAELRQLSTTRSEMLLDWGRLTSVNLGRGRESDVISGSHFGNFGYYHRAADGGMEPQRLVVDPRGLLMRSVAINPKPLAYADPTTGLSDLIVGGESPLAYYCFAGRFDGRGDPVYEPARFVLEQEAALHPGSLPVVCTADWDGDGAMDLIVGNSEGRILWFRNAGTNERPAMLPGVPLQAGGREIHIQTGYHEVQGPQEARWGYACPAVIDWNGDGLPDLLVSSATSEHVVYLNRGTRGKPALEAARPLYCRGLELHGTWRVRPGVGMLGGRLAYVALDDQDEFHWYARIDDYNLEDKGKLRMQDGTTIRANYRWAGGTGRAKILLADWDGDGKVDLLVGVGRQGSIPNPQSGLPQSLGTKGAAVIFLRNVGSNEAPVFGKAAMMKFRGAPIYLGTHDCGPALWDVGQRGGPDLVVGDQCGVIRYYARKDLSWEPDAGGLLPKVTNMFSGK